MHILANAMLLQNAAAKSHSFQTFPIDKISIKTILPQHVLMHVVQIWSVMVVKCIFGPGRNNGVVLLMRSWDLTKIII